MFFHSLINNKNDAEKAVDSFGNLEENKTFFSVYTLIVPGDPADEVERLVASHVVDEPVLILRTRPPVDSSTYLFICLMQYFFLFSAMIFCFMQRLFLLNALISFAGLFTMMNQFSRDKEPPGRLYCKGHDAD